MLSIRACTFSWLLLRVRCSGRRIAATGNSVDPANMRIASITTLF